MKPAPFAYHRPTAATEAVALLRELGDDAKVLAGGQSLVPMLSLRLAVFEHLIDIGRIETLRGIEQRDGFRRGRGPVVREGRGLHGALSSPPWH